MQRLRDGGLQDDEEEREDEGGEEGRAGRLLRDGRRYAGEQLHSAWDETKGSNRKTVGFPNTVL